MPASLNTVQRMESSDVALLISALSLALAGLSLGWQVCQWLLSAGRPKATLLHGLVNGSSAYFGPVKPSGVGFDLQNLRQQGVDGFEAVGIQITNHGRAPVIVESVKLRPRGGVMQFVAIEERIGPELPHTLVPGSNASGFIDAERASTLAYVSRETLKENVTGVYMTAQLGTGKSIKTRRTLRV